MRVSSSGEASMSINPLFWVKEMVSDPLTKFQKDEWWKLVRKVFDEKYAMALTSGAIGEEDVSRGDHTLAKCVLQITARQFEPVSPIGKAMLENLEKFI